MKFFIVTLLLVFLTSCRQGQMQTNRTQDSANNIISEKMPTPPAEEEKVSETECKICDFDFANYKGDLKKEEIQGLLLALNDEYMAFATYEQINKDFNDPHPFINIQKAEAQQAEKLKQIFETYKLPIPENKWLGNSPKFQSVSGACIAGVEGVIANSDLFDKLLRTTKRMDILKVYLDLKRASKENHLPAFERCEGGNGRGRF